MGGEILGLICAVVAVAAAVLMALRMGAENRRREAEDNARRRQERDEHEERLRERRARRQQAEAEQTAALAERERQRQREDEARAAAQAERERQLQEERAARHNERLALLSASDVEELTVSGEYLHAKLVKPVPGGATLPLGTECGCAGSPASCIAFEHTRPGGRTRWVVSGKGGGCCKNEQPPEPIKVEPECSDGCPKVYVDLNGWRVGGGVQQEDVPKQPPEPSPANR